MIDPKFMILYVDNPGASASFYANLFDRQAVDVSPTFALFALPSGLMLGLWSKHTVEPKATPVGGSEIGISVADSTIVTDLHASWVRHGLPIMQEPTQMDFGFTFVATDPDGHRLRVFAPSQR